MASEWPVVSLGEVINLKRGYDLAAREREIGRVPIISSSGETGTHSKAIVDAPGVVTGRYGTKGWSGLPHNEKWERIYHDPRMPSHHAAPTRGALPRRG